MDAHRKRLQFRAWRRGFREIDLILGQFADKTLADMDEGDLGLFEALLNEPDQDVYDWLAAREPPPERYAALIVRIQKISVPLTRPQ
jgi:antitoxin CptB